VVLRGTANGRACRAAFGEFDSSRPAAAVGRAIVATI